MRMTMGGGRRQDVCRGPAARTLSGSGCRLLERDRKGVVDPMSAALMPGRRQGRTGHAGGLGKRQARRSSTAAPASTLISSTSACTM